MDKIEKLLKSNNNDKLNIEFKKDRKRIKPLNVVYNRNKNKFFDIDKGI